MLAVRVGGDDYLPGLIDACPVQPGAYGCTFAQVDGVGDNGCPVSVSSVRVGVYSLPDPSSITSTWDALAVGGELVY